MTHPFLRLPYDPWEHLIKIRSIYDEGINFLFWPEDWSSFWLWHWMWAKLFRLFGIDETFTFAYVIHYCQIFLSLGCVYFFSFTILNLLSGGKQTGKLLQAAALFATIFWLVGNGTFSVELQQAWIVWYSVTYQGFTIPVYWLTCGVTAHLLFSSSLTVKQTVIYLLMILLGLAGIVSFHPTEALYYLVFLFACLIFTPRMSHTRKITGLLVFAAMVATVAYTVYTLKLPGVQGLKHLLDIPKLLESVSLVGEWLIEGGGNKVKSSYSELALFSTVIGFVFCLIKVFLLKERSDAMWAALILYTTCILLVPMTSWFGGVVGTLVHKDIVWRFFFASPWFVFLPAIFSGLFVNRKYSVACLVSSLVVALLMSFFISERYLNGAVSGNARSLISLLSKDEVGLQYDRASRDLLKSRIEAELRDTDKKNALLYMRGDLATIARGLYGYYVYSHRRVIKPMRQFYDSRLDNTYKLIPVEVPLDYPKDRHIFLHFDLDAKYLSDLQGDLAIKGEQDVLYHLDSMDINKKYLFISGWALLSGVVANSEVFVVLTSDENQYIFDTSEKFRPDIGMHFGHRGYENNGFLATIQRRDMEDGVYSLGLFVRQGDYSGYCSSEIKIVLQ